MDNGYTYTVCFSDSHCVQWSINESSPKEGRYECLKGDETTYLVHVHPGAPDSVRLNWIIDTDRRLVTLVTMEEGFDSCLPRLIRVNPVFGAIQEPGLPLPGERHYFSDRMTGRHILWHYTTAPPVQHIYTGLHVMRSCVGRSEDHVLENLFKERMRSSDPEIRRKGAEGLESLKKRNEYYPLYEEECFHIAVSPKLNLLCFVEENVLRRDPEHLDGGGGILLLQDIERLIDMGVCFGAGSYYMCTAFGEEIEDGDPIDRLPSPYDYSVCTAMPCMHASMKTADKL